MMDIVRAVGLGQLDVVANNLANMNTAGFKGRSSEIVEREGFEGDVMFSVVSGKSVMSVLK